MNDIGHWTFPYSFKPTDWIGFVYQITNQVSGRIYYGKKFFQSTTHKRITGRVNRKKVIKESNWKTYTSSSKELNEDIAHLGKDKFTFTILSLHECRSSLAYAECKRILDSDSLLYPERFYNGMLPPIKYHPKPPTERELQHSQKVVF